jgi:hypothetical protein
MQLVNHPKHTLMPHVKRKKRGPFVPLTIVLGVEVRRHQETFAMHSLRKSCNVAPGRIAAAGY